MTVHLSIKKKRYRKSKKKCKLKLFIDEFGAQAFLICKREKEGQQNTYG
jgi:hypothetical protein